MELLLQIVIMVVLALVPDPQTTKGKFIKRKTKISNYKTGQ
jgi:hypothetical protein